MSLLRTLLGLGAAVLAGCATNPDKISAAYVSTLQYEPYNCQQIAAEQAHIERRTLVLYNQLKKARNADNAQMGVGLILFWPALFLLEGGDGPEATEYASLQGHYEALRTVSVQKECGLAFRDKLSTVATEAKSGEAEGRDGGTESTPLSPPVSGPSENAGGS